MRRLSEYARGYLVGNWRAKGHIMLYLQGSIQSDE